MVKLFIVGLFVLLSTVYVTIIAKEDPGYALISHGDWSVEMTLVLLVIGFFAVILSILLAIYIFYKLLGVPETIINWNEKRKVNSANKSANKGMIQLAEGNWKAAERYLGKGVDSNNTPLLNYIAAARAAQKQNKQSQRDKYLSLAFKHYPEAQMAIGITQAELEIKAKEYDQALITLKHLYSLDSSHKQVLLMLVELYKTLLQWGEISSLLADVKQKRLYSNDEFQELELETYRHRMSSAADREDLIGLNNIWSNFNKKTINNVLMRCFYSKLLIKLGDDEEAAIIIKETLKKEWTDEAIRIYGFIREDDGVAQLKMTEKYLTKYKDNAALLFSLSQICLANQLWGKAKDYLKESIEIEANAEKWHILGHLYEVRLNDTKKSMACYREGLALCQPETQSGLDLAEQMALDSIDIESD